MTQAGSSSASATRTAAATDVHLVGGPGTIETFRQLDALDLLGLIVCPILVGGGLQLTPALATGTQLTLESERRLPTGAVELVYAFA